MPRRDDLESILIVGSGPIVIGQGCEFDYSGTQACKALREEGYRIVLVNSNPATIMTDPELADRTYVEPITAETVAKVIERERPDAILPTLGGQTALNTAVELHASGVLERFEVEMIGAKVDAIRRGEDRDLFRATMRQIGLDTPRSGLATSLEEARRVLAEVGLPCVIRPAFTLGGTGGGVAYNVEEFETIVQRGIDYSMIGQVLVEEAVLGWKEFELEVMRDCLDNVVVVCSIENLDPMGIHTGDSITVAPAQTLTDREYQRMRDAAAAVIRAVGVETGGSNIQFAVHPGTGRLVAIEMNPRVSRSSALASKATGFPIAKIAAKLAVGYSLDEIPNDITKETPACFEPTIDYVVVKVPRFAFEKFPKADPTLTTQMKSVGEVMAIGRTFGEAFQKALRGLETGLSGFGADGGTAEADEEALRRGLRVPTKDRVLWLHEAFRRGLPIEEVHELTRIDPWFLAHLRELVAREARLLEAGPLERVSKEALEEAKRAGFSDRALARAWRTDEQAVRARRTSLGVRAIYKLVDTCAAEFEAYTPYYYSTCEEEDEARVSSKKKVVILGGGPNRIGQGIEFDYCCVHAAFALKELGFETIMVNSNPETVSTDFDTSDLLFFEPLTHEDVRNILERLKPDGVIVQFGGQTPLNLARGLADAGAPIIGTSVASIERAEDRALFNRLVKKLGLRQADGGMAASPSAARRIAKRIGYPVLVRPSFVLGGRAMEIVYDEGDLDRYLRGAVAASEDRPVLVDRFLEDAIEVDVDAIADGETVVIGGIMEHIEEAGIHSGDSCCAIPPFSLGTTLLDEIRDWTVRLARELKVVGLMNVQYAVKGDRLYVLEVNPRASRTVPFVSKATGVPLAKLAAKVMVGRKLKDLGFTEEVAPRHVSVKAPVFPFNRFPGIDMTLGPEMRSTGEVMGIDEDFGRAFAKAMLGAGHRLPLRGRVFISVKDEDKRGILFVAKRLVDLGFALVATDGTWRFLRTHGIESERVNKIHEGRPHVVDLIKNRGVDLLLNTPLGKVERSDDAAIRSEAVLRGVPCVTTLAGASALVGAIEAMRKRPLEVAALQDWHATGAGGGTAGGGAPPERGRGSVDPRP
ncbi:MAG TPA: carbamoyl-phosphate synthase large subunit [Planctomycetota bacterium]|nr:carbamoyl-phosphate synthase large subunit [Planctomycetota bacterium]